MDQCKGFQIGEHAVEERKEGRKENEERETIAIMDTPNPLPSCFCL
jgi:hypothetical protein